MRFCLLGFLTFAAWPLLAQQVSGSITGQVVDPSSSAVSGASVLLSNQGTRAQAETRTDAQGHFEFLSLLPGIYEVMVESAGFKKLTRTGLSLSASQRLATGPLSLTLGSVTESVTISSKVDPVQTASGERSGVVSRTLLDNLPSLSRDPIELITLMPGVVSPSGSAYQYQGTDNFRGFNVNGARANNKNLNLDGVSTMDTSNHVQPSVSLNMDAIEEVQVQLTNYQAEYGRTAGGVINIITRSGTRDFHGSAYFYIRNEALNANSFFNNRFATKKPVYRYRTQGFTLGGPVFIPGKFNKDRHRLFFFFSESQQPTRLPPGLNQVQMPTELERRGDFSQTVDQRGTLIRITDPLTHQPFANNVVPTSRLNAFGVQLLNIFPLPNITDALRRFNFQNTVIPLEKPRREEVLKVDYNLSSRILLYGRYVQDKNDSVFDPITNYNGARMKTIIRGKNLSFRSVQTISSTLVSEVTLGYNRLPNELSPNTDKDLAGMQRSALGVQLGQFNRESNPLGLVPSLTWGTLLSGNTAPKMAPDYGSQNFEAYTLSENLSKTIGQHSMKFGVYWERAVTRMLPGRIPGLTGFPGAQFSGAINFAVDTTNPNDSGYAYANAALGNFRDYKEVSSQRETPFAFTNLEWYAQDNWRVTRKLTLDFGVRFYRHPPIYPTSYAIAGFDPAKWEPSKQVRLYRPFRDATGNIVGRDPLTGAMVARPLIGAIVPGSGDIGNGMVLSTDSGISSGIMKNRGVHHSPRFGFAYDPRGRGKTVIRGGFSMLYDRQQSYIGERLSQNPPIVVTPTIFNGNLNTFLNTSGVAFPQNVFGVGMDGKLLTVMDFSFGFQHRVGDAFLVDVAYVGALDRHLAEVREYNATPFGTNFLIQNEDPTAPGRALTQTFLRRYQGFDAINMTEFSGNASYHSLQTQVKRRFARGLTFDVAWTWSKVLSYGEFDTTARSLFLPGWRDYGKPTYDATHVLSINYVYDIPWVKGLQIAGITSFQSGRPAGIAFSQPGADFTGSTEQGRLNLIADPLIPKSDRSLSRSFNTAAVARPTPGIFGVTRPQDVDLGNAAKDVFREPGINNFNLSVVKNFQFAERHRLQIRAEAYNAFNHTQFDRVDNTARYSATGQQTNATFGEYRNDRGARIIQLGLRYAF